MFSRHQAGSQPGGWSAGRAVRRVGSGAAQVAGREEGAVLAQPGGGAAGRQFAVRQDVAAVGHFPALRSLGSRKAGLLSGGEQQMLAIARVLSRRPKLLMLDEMSLGLAPVIVDRLLPVVREFATSHGAGVLLVEQHVHLALKIADRGYILSHGELAASGSATQLSRDPALLAATYLGGAPSPPGGAAGR